VKWRQGRFTLCGLAALGFDVTARLFGRTFTRPGKNMMRKIILGGIFLVAILHPAAYSLQTTWRLYQVTPKEATPEQFYQVASARWVEVPSNRNRWRGPELGVDETVMYFNLKKI
jgi:hypothetical protein